MSPSMGAGGAASDLRRVQRALEQLRSDVARLTALVEALQARIKALENQ